MRSTKQCVMKWHRWATVNHKYENVIGKKQTNKQNDPRLNSLTTTYTYPQQIGFVPLSKLLWTAESDWITTQSLHNLVKIVSPT